MKIVFVDPKCPTPYDSEVLRTRGLGGTEGTVIRIAQGLSDDHSVHVLQHNRVTEVTENDSLRYSPIGVLDSVVRDADHVIFIQKAQHIQTVARKSRARLWIWLHNFLKDEVPFFWQDHLRYKLGLICVSRTHAEHSRKYIQSMPKYWGTLGLMGRGGILYHYNPLADGLVPDPSVTRDRHKMVFFSSPYKGIEHVIDAFKEIHEVIPDLRLYVADPGYIRNFNAETLNIEGIVKLGTLPQRAVIQHVREALCVFYPQRKRPETFGLVFAEANAVGTPVLAHDFGAAKEILCPSNYPIDTSKPELILHTIKAWVENGGSLSHAQPQFQGSHVIKKWNQFLTNPDKFIELQESESK